MHIHVFSRNTASSATPAGDFPFQETGPWLKGCPPGQVRLPGACFRISKAGGLQIVREHMQVTLTLGGMPMATVVVVYQPSKCSAAAFFQGCSCLCEGLSVRNKVLILWDFNFHMDGPSNENAKRLTALLESWNCVSMRDQPLIRTVTSSTCWSYAVPTTCMVVPRSVVTSDFISDHRCVTWYLRVPAPISRKNTVVFRKLKCIGHIAFRRDLERLSVIKAPSDDLQSVVEQHSLHLGTQLDRHASLRERRLTLRPHSARYSVDVREAKQLHTAVETPSGQWPRSMNHSSQRTERRQLSVMLIMVCCATGSKTDTASLAPAQMVHLISHWQDPEGGHPWGQSQAQSLELEVQQGSVLGPMLFTLYSAPVGIIVPMHCLSVHLYANDSKLYLAVESVGAEAECRQHLVGKSSEAW